jgi:hypothetical protein
MSASSDQAAKPADDQSAPRVEIKKWNAVALWSWGTLILSCFETNLPHLFHASTQF